MYIYTTIMFKNAVVLNLQLFLCIRSTFLIALRLFLFCAGFDTVHLVFVATKLLIGGLTFATVYICIFTFVAAFCDTGRVSKADLYTWDHQTFDLAFPHIALAPRVTVGFAGRFAGLFAKTEIRTSG